MDWRQIDDEAENLPPRTSSLRNRLATIYSWRDPVTIPPRDWIYGREILRGHVRGLIAAGGAGKTILSVGEALAMATGRDLLGKSVPGGPKRVWLWNLEDDVDELGRIIQAACKHWKIGPDDFGDRLLVDSALDGKILKLATSGTSDGLVFNRPLVDDLIAELTDYQIDYLHVDPFVSSHTADESSNMEIDAIAKEWARVAKVSGSAIGLAHHTSKSGATEVTALSARGAVALINACRSVLTINRMSDEEARAWGIEGERRRRYFRTYDDKNNRKPPSDQSDWYHMASVDLGNGGPLDGGDSIGVVIPWSPPDAFDGVTATHLYQVQKLIDEGDWRANWQGKPWAGEAVGQVLGIDHEDKSGRSRIIKLIKTWTDNGALIVEERRDQKSRTNRPYIIVGTWAVDSAAPLNSSGAVRSVAVEHQERCTTPSPLIGEGGVAAGAGDGISVVQTTPSIVRNPFDDSQWEDGR